VAHVDLTKDWDADTVRDAITAHLRPQPVVVLAAERVPDTFDARFSAVKRHYRYCIVNRRAISRSGAGAPGGCRGRSTTRRCTRRRSIWSPARLHDLSSCRLPGEVACENSRPARRDARG